MWYRCWRDTQGESSKHYLLSVCTPACLCVKCVLASGVYVCACTEPSGVVSAFISSDIIHGNESNRFLLNMRLCHFQTAGQDWNSVGTAVMYRQTMLLWQMSRGREWGLFSIISWLSQVMFLYKWRSWWIIMIWSTGKSCDKTREWTRKSKRAHYLGWRECASCRTETTTDSIGTASNSIEECSGNAL